MTHFINLSNKDPFDFFSRMNIVFCVFLSVVFVFSMMTIKFGEANLTFLIFLLSIYFTCIVAAFKSFNEVRIFFSFAIFTVINILKFNFNSPQDNMVDYCKYLMKNRKLETSINELSLSHDVKTISENIFYFFFYMLHIEENKNKLTKELYLSLKNKLKEEWILFEYLKYEGKKCNQKNIDKIFKFMNGFDSFEKNIFSNKIANF